MLINFISNNKVQDVENDPDQKRIVFLFKDKNNNPDLTVQTTNNRPNKSPLKNSPIKPVKSNSHSNISSLKITVIHNEPAKSAAVLQGESAIIPSSQQAPKQIKPSSVPSSPTKKANKRRVYLKKEQLTTTTTSSVLTKTTSETSTIVKSKSIAISKEDGELTPPIDPVIDAASAVKKRCQHQTSVGSAVEEDFLDISIGEKDTSIII